MLAFMSIEVTLLSPMRALQRLVNKKFIKLPSPPPPPPPPPPHGHHFQVAFSRQTKDSERIMIIHRDEFIIFNAMYQTAERSSSVVAASSDIFHYIPSGQ